jgi:hypothetical protein
VCLLDSSSRVKIDQELGTAIAQVLPPDALKKGYIVFKLLKTQKQASCVCGYFALAFASVLCFGLNPDTLFFDQEQLIQHYIDCVFHNKKK